MKTATLKKVLKYIKAYRISTAISIVTAAVSAFLALMIPIKIGAAIDLIIDKGQVDFNSLMPLLGQTAVMLTITAILQWIMNDANNRIVFNVVSDLRKSAFSRIQKLPLSFIDSNKSGEIVSRVIADAEQFTDGLLLGFSQLFTGVVTIICTLGFMFYINYIIALVVVILTPLSLVCANFISKHTYKMFLKQAEIRGELTSYADEMIVNMKMVMAYSKGEDCYDNFKEINQRLQKCSVKATFFSSLTNPTTRFINALVYASVTLIGAIFAVGGSLTIGGLAIFLSYASQYTKPFNEIAGVFTEVQNSLVCAQRLFDLIETPIEKSDDSKKELGNIDGDVSLQNICFSYTKSKPLITDFSLDVKAGQHIAIVGPTGCGKTTLINLLMRFYDVDSGCIKIDGVDIREISRESLRRNFGMVLQDTWIKTGTVRENIAFGMPNATDEQIVAAAKAVHAHGFIKRLPNGYDTILTDDGAGLSQGQKQLLCICRVMLCKPPMLILDEATSSIDTRTERRISRAFTKMMNGRTSFIVAHRLATVRDADLILVMRDGNVVEKGSHDDLIKQNGFYKQIYDSQFM